MVWFARIVAALLSDAFRLVLLLLRWKQLAQYIERGVKPRRVYPVTRIGLALLTRWFDWQNAVAIVRPKTIIRWHLRDGDCFGDSSANWVDRRFQQNREC